MLALPWHLESTFPRYTGHGSFPLSIQPVCLSTKSLQSCLTLCDPYRLVSTRLLYPWDSRGKNTRVGCHALLKGIFPTQGSTPPLLCLLHWQLGSLPLAPPGKPHLRIVEAKRLTNRETYTLNNQAVLLGES